MPIINAAGGVPVGTSILVTGNSVPPGFLKENGAAVSRTIYAALFAVIGTAYGAGDGATTFNIPDSRGEFFRCLDDGRGVDVGRAFNAAQAGAVESHAHAIPTITGGNWSGNNAYNKGVGQSWSSGQTDSAGAGETRPRNVARLACIKY